MVAEAAGYSSDELDTFTAALNGAGITAEVFGKVGAGAFMELYNSAHGNLSAVLEGINIINSTGLEPKHLYVTDDGTVKVKTDELTALDLIHLAEKGFTVTDKGTIQKVGDALQALDMMTANPQVTVGGGALETLQAIRSVMSVLNGASAIVSVSAQRSGFASGGISQQVIQQIPTHADGMALNGIVTSAMLTNTGLVGENGAEAVFQMGGSSAIVPLTNRRYVRPFAQAVASEIPQRGGETNNYTLVVDGAVINDDPHVRGIFIDLMGELQRKAAMNFG